VPADEDILSLVITPATRAVLVVEKDAVFRTLAADARVVRDTVLVTGKGYPDAATAELVVRLARDHPDLPVYALVDGDPHGVEILATYALGSAARAYDAARLACPSIRWLGVRAADLPPHARGLLPLTPHDRTKVLQLLRRPGLPDGWRAELQRMLVRGVKAEIEALPDVAGYVVRRLDELDAEALANDLM
jgi:meiotic recombination protein SPO11